MAFSITYLALLISWNIVSAQTYHCPKICRCSTQFVKCTKKTAAGVPAAILRSYSSLRFTHLPLRKIQRHSFEGLSNIIRIDISQSDSLERIETQAFVDLKDLMELFSHRFQLRHSSNMLHYLHGENFDLKFNSEYKAPGEN